MSVAPPLKKNDEPAIAIDALSSEGSGVGRVSGYAVFVPGALPGELVRAHIIKTTGAYAVAKLRELLSTSSERAEPRCPAYAACGGCVLQHLRYEAQLREKRRMVADALARLGHFHDPPVLPMLGMDDPWRYRNKGSFPFGGCDMPIFGLYAARSHRLVPISDCPIQDERVLALTRRIQAWAEENRIPAYDEYTHTGSLRQAVVRVTGTGESLVTVVTYGPLKGAGALIDALADADSLWHNQNDRDTNVIFGERFTLLRGSPRVAEDIGGLRFSLGPQSFLQVNPAQTGLLYERALALLSPSPGETVIDAYCGVGTISLPLARRCARVIGIEQSPAAVEDAKANARQNAAENAEFLCGGVEDVLPSILRRTPVSALLLDPPRKGCEESAIRAIGESRLKRLVYISCNPATLARDCERLASYGFALAAVQPVDMFPHTAHVEAAALLKRGSYAGSDTGFSAEGSAPGIGEE